MYESFKNYGYIIAKIRELLKDYIEKNKIQSLIIGVSGGIDSALCCALARPVCNSLDISLIGVSLPIYSNTYDEKNRAKNVGKILCTDFEEINKLEDVMTLFPIQVVTSDYTDLKYKIRLGNLKARLRMIYLYDLAQKNNGMVLSTDNFTEYLLGFWTLHGDVGDYGMIQSLWKTEVYKISEYLKDTESMNALQDCIDAVPTDGLGISNSDLEQIDASSYKEVDKILKSVFIYGEDKYKNHPVILRYNKTMFKRNNQCNIHRGDLK